MRLSSADYLTVECSFVSDAGIAHLDGLANLYGLRLRNSRITDSGMQHVGTLSGLVELDLEAEQFTDALRAALPNCEIHGLRRKFRTESPLLNRILVCGSS